jgi:hypothetical protein
MNSYRNLVAKQVIDLTGLEKSFFGASVTPKWHRFMTYSYIKL